MKVEKVEDGGKKRLGKKAKEGGKKSKKVKKCAVMSMNHLRVMYLSSSLDRRPTNGLEPHATVRGSVAWCHMWLVAFQDA